MRLRGSWHLIGLLAVAIALGVAAVVELGPPTSSARTSREVVTAAQGVVQSTVTGTGNVEPSTDVEADFQTSGTLQHVYIADGDQVVKGQLIATLDPSAADRTVDQAQESLTAAQDQLANAEAATVTTASSTDTGSTSTAQDTALELPDATTTTTTTVTVTAPQRTTTTPTRPTTTRTTPTRRTTTNPTPTTTTTTTAPTRTTTNAGNGSSQSSSGSTGASSGGETADAKAAAIASAEASVDSAEASLTNAERSLSETKLYAPATGTVVSIQDISPGDAVSGASGSSSASDSSSGSSGSSGSSASGSGSSAATSAGSLGSSSSSSSSSSSTGFAEIVNTHTMTMTVAFSESDISKVKVGQPATVTLEALAGVELGAHVTSISTLGTTSDSVVSYDATLTLDQRDSQVKPGMSASAAVITGQAHGITLPNSAVASRGTTSSVQQLRNGKTVTTPVIVGVQGDTRTQIVSGLSAGDQVVVTTTLPSLGAASTSSSGASGALGGATRLGGFGAAGFGGAGFGGGAGFARRLGGG